MRTEQIARTDLKVGDVILFNGIESDIEEIDHDERISSWVLFADDGGQEAYLFEDFYERVIS